MNEGETSLLQWQNLQSLDLAELIDILKAQHTDFLDSDLPELQELAHLLADRPLERFLENMAEELAIHFRTEEKVVFPVLESLRAETRVDVSLVYPSFLTTEIRADDRSSENPAESRKARGSLTPDIAAKRIARAIETRSKRLYIPLQSAVARILWNFAPSLYFRIMEKRA